MFGDGLFDGDVVLEEQWFGAVYYEVVDDHRDEVEFDGVVLVYCLGDRQFGVNFIGGRCE